MLGAILATTLTTARADWYGREDACEDRGGYRGGYERDYGDRGDGGYRGGYVDHGGYSDRGGYREYRRPVSIEARAQMQLRRLGFYYGPIDGSFGSGSRRALHRFQYERDLPCTGYLDWRTLRALGLR